MLDDLKLIHERDQVDALGIAEKQGQQLDENFEIENGERCNGDGLLNIVYGAMGGSALAAILSQSWPGYRVPFEVVRGYDIPRYVGDQTLFIAASYSGNTEETLEAIERAKQQGARIAVIAGGGKLADVARENGYPLVILPKAAQPRYAVLFNLKALLVLLERYGVTDQTTIDELLAARDALLAATARWAPTVPTADNLAKQIAQECIGKSIVVYGGPKFAPVAYKWKISFNENAKQVAWTGTYPEFNHNEFIGWSKQPLDKPYTVIDLRSNLEHPRVLKRFEISERMLSGMRPAPIVVQPEGQSLIEQILYTVALGDFVSLYTALLNGLNPAPVELVEKFKQELVQ
jgi:glucose/mannose-6-phosphate isomerase